MPNVQELFGLNPVKGDYGVEIEMEFENRIREPFGLSNWRFEADGSLRGPSVEAVMASPKKLKTVATSILSLKKYLEEKQGLTVADSVRAGVHVHRNVQTWDLKEVLKVVAVYFCFETVLLKYCGDSRVGNLFCLRNRDARAYSRVLVDCVQGNFDPYLFQGDHYRYASLNLQSLFRYGSIEFRGFRTPKDISEVVEWVEILDKFLEFAKGVRTPAQVAEGISFAGPEALLREVFGDYADKLIYKGFEDDMYADIRAAQELIYELGDV